jgi:shikimate dehydrogenase
VVALVGADLDTTLTPALHEREADLLGLRYIYKTVDVHAMGSAAVRLGDLFKAARWLGMAGCNVTHPCKQQVIPLLDDLAPDAAAIGAVNTVVFEDGRAVGHNTDWSGFAASLRRGLPGAAMGNVTLLGAGGAGSAVGYALLSIDVAQVTVIDVRPESAAVLADSLARQFGPDRAMAVSADLISEAVSAADGLVNATPAGMTGRPDLPLPASVLRGDLWVADVVYRPLETPLLTMARRIGCRTLSGGGMAVYQAAHAFRLFTGVEPDERRMLAHFSELAAPVGSEG